MLIREKDLTTCRDEVKRYANEKKETGFMVLGKIRTNKVYVITKIVSGGPGTERHNISFTTDEISNSKILEHERAIDDEVRYLSDFHSHPWPESPNPSGVDFNQLKRARNLRPWFVIGVFSSIGEMRVFGLGKDESLKEIPLQIIPDDFDESDLVSRIDKITNNETLQKMRVGILGCGSLGSAVVTGLAGSGIGEYVLCDMDEFALVNVIRHTGGIQQIGNPKTSILSEHIQNHNPLANVLTVNDDLIKNNELLRSVVESCDLVIASSGNPELNYHINSICVEINKPVIYGGIYAGAKSAYVFRVTGKNHPCFDCIFQLTSTAIDQNTLKRKYGLEDGELKEAQGMIADISIPGNMMAKMALWLLLGKEFSFNLVRYYDNLKVDRLNVQKRNLCATCDYENWLKREERKLEEESKTGKIVEKIKNKLGRKRK